MRGSRRVRNESFSSSGIGFCSGIKSSPDAQPLPTRFLRYTTARMILVTKMSGERPHQHTRESYTGVLFGLEDVEKGIRKGWLVFCLVVTPLAE